MSPRLQRRDWLHRQRFALRYRSIRRIDRAGLASQSLRKSGRGPVCEVSTTCQRSPPLLGLLRDHPPDGLDPAVRRVMERFDARVTNVEEPPKQG